MSNGKEGERLFAQIMEQSNYVVEDVSGNADYFAKDIDFIITSPTGNTKTFEVKWCSRISQTGNLFLEFSNPRSKQWNGEGWWKHCEADFLVYGDSVNQQFYIYPMKELRERVDQLCLRYARTDDESVGWLLHKSKVKDLAVQI